MAKKLLLVDDEQPFLEGLKEYLSEQSEVFTTDICHSVNQAIKLCKKKTYDLIISDIRMPIKTGIDFFIWLKKNNYKGGFIAMTAYGTVKVLKKIKKLGSLDVILKPFDLEWFQNKILEYFSEYNDGISGTINSIDITSLLQMINLEQKTVTIKINQKNKTGYLYFEKGNIVHAEYDGLEGEDAAHSLLNTNRGKFSLVPFPEEIKRTIDLPFMMLLMNSTKTMDEELNSLNDDNKIIPLKEKKMNVKELEKSIEVLKESLGSGLLATDIFGVEDGQSIAGYNSQPQACALFTEISNFMNRVLSESGFPVIGKYYMLDLVDNKMVMVLTMGDYLWGMLLDKNHAKLGMLLNIVIPKAIDAFEKAIAG
jgi:response regulator of citrate/malate metabolism